MDRKEVQAQGGIEKIGLKDSFLKFVAPNNEKIILKRYISEHTEGIEFILNTLTSKEYGCLQSLNKIAAVGHRVVHGGEKFNTSVLITQEVIDQIVQCSELAPLHNPANLKGIYTISKLLPKIPQIAVFDTAFHQTMPDYAYMYALPYELYTQYGVRRYGFHGTSHRYVSQRACAFLQTTPAGKRIIICHIGNGGSITAVKDGKSIDTSMGFTPVEGLMMGTRCGDIDAGALTYIMDKKNLDIAGISDLLNKQSGILGVSGISSDMRELEKGVAEGNKRAILADAMYDYRIKKYVGAYVAMLGGVDIIVFTGGVGENKGSCRYEVCKDLEFMGVKIDKEVNDRI
jgi:acetate kinase